jgi:hypothetical protein
MSRNQGISIRACREGKEGGYVFGHTTQSFTNDRSNIMVQEIQPLQATSLVLIIVKLYLENNYKLISPP